MVAPGILLPGARRASPVSAAQEQRTPTTCSTAWYGCHCQLPCADDCWGRRSVTASLAYPPEPSAPVQAEAEAGGAPVPLLRYAGFTDGPRHSAAPPNRAPVRFAISGRVVIVFSRGLQEIESRPAWVMGASQVREVGRGAAIHACARVRTCARCSV